VPWWLPGGYLVVTWWCPEGLPGAWNLNKNNSHLRKKLDITPSTVNAYSTEWTSSVLLGAEDI
jgi:hypothetical protein